MGDQRRTKDRGIDRDHVYSVLGASKILGVTYDAVLRYIRDEKLPAEKVRTKGLRKEWRIRGAEIEDFRKPG